MELTFVTGGVLLAGIAMGYGLRIWIALRKRTSLETIAKEKIDAAEREAKEIILDAKEKAASALADIKREEREMKADIRRLEERLLRKEDDLERKRKELDALTEEEKRKTKLLKKQEEELLTEKEKILHELERIAGLKKEDAKQELMKSVKEAYKKELAETMVTLERKRQEKIEAKTLEIITTAIQRYSRNAVADLTSSTVHLPNEEIKGKIIGREGRNIRTFERLTGVEIVIDESPETILLSSFDPLRREIARVALEKLLKDGRIQPAKIEEKVEEAKKELDEQIRKIGEEAAYEVGIMDLPKELIPFLGRLNFRTSYGQNVLQHSIEMAHIAGMIAAELKIDVETTKRAALLHDIGKAIDHETEGTHVEIGRKLLKKYGVAEPVIRAMEAHHEEYPFSTPESYVVAAADAISSARPGARRETLEKYLKRLEDIERVVNEFEGVSQSYAVSAGREVRVFVRPEKIDDFGALELAKKIADKIQQEVQYPGEIKVTVIREIKAVEYAK